MKFPALACLIGLSVGASAQSARNVQVTPSSGANTPVFVIDSVVYSPNVLTYLSPDNIEQINVFKTDSVNAVYHTHNGVVMITMKEGHRQFKSLSQLISDEPGIADLPKVYIINGGVELNPDSAIVDPMTVTSAKVIRTSQIVTAGAKPAPMAIVLITLEGNVKPMGPKGKPGETTVILR